MSDDVPGLYGSFTHRANPERVTRPRPNSVERTRLDNTVLTFDPPGLRNLWLSSASPHMSVDVTDEQPTIWARAKHSTQRIPTESTHFLGDFLR
jgi:hypothetical protein